jgi:hypothetical protein
MKLYKNSTLGASVDLSHKRIYFWGGIFSQWYKVPVSDPLLKIDAVCAEQLMMVHKAILFGDDEAWQAILATNNAAEQKAIGRTVKNFDPVLWDSEKLNIVTNISYWKFTQNEKLKDLLIMTDGFELVEASPTDLVWGVGLAEDDPLILDKENWKGENLLGIALMKARSFIIAEELS